MLTWLWQHEELITPLRSWSLLHTQNAWTMIRDLGCTVKYWQKRPESCTMLPFCHGRIRSFMELFILCSIIPFKSLGKSMNEHYRHSKMDTVLEDNNRKITNIVIKLVRVDSHSVKVTNLGIIKCQPLTCVSWHASLAFKCAITCQCRVPYSLQAQT